MPLANLKSSFNKLFKDGTCKPKIKFCQTVQRWRLQALYHVMAAAHWTKTMKKIYTSIKGSKPF